MWEDEDSTLHGWELFNCDLQQWFQLSFVSFSCFIYIYICLSVCHFVKGNECWKCTHCFCLVDIKKHSFLTFCVFWLVLLLLVLVVVLVWGPGKLCLNRISHNDNYKLQSSVINIFALRENVGSNYCIQMLTIHPDVRYLKIKHPFQML